MGNKERQMEKMKQEAQQALATKDRQIGKLREDAAQLQHQLQELRLMPDGAGDGVDTRSQVQVNKLTVVALANCIVPDWTAHRGAIPSMSIETVKKGKLLLKKSTLVLLAHLSRRLIGELIVYKGIRRPSVRRPSVCQHFQTTSPLKP